MHLEDKILGSNKFILLLFYYLYFLLLCCGFQNKFHFESNKKYEFNGHLRHFLV